MKGAHVLQRWHRVTQFVGQVDLVESAIERTRHLPRQWLVAGTPVPATGRPPTPRLHAQPRSRGLPAKPPSSDRDGVVECWCLVPASARRASSANVCAAAAVTAPPYAWRSTDWVATGRYPSGVIQSKIAPDRGNGVSERASTAVAACSSAAAAPCVWHLWRAAVSSAKRAPMTRWSRHVASTAADNSFRACFPPAREKFKSPATPVVLGRELGDLS